MLVPSSDVTITRASSEDGTTVTAALVPVGSASTVGAAPTGVNVPGDVLVIGFDGISSGEYSVPTLTAVVTDFRGMANTSVSLLMRRIEHSDDEFYPQTVNVGYRLIERESTRR